MNCRSDHYRIGEDGTRNVPKKEYKSEKEALKFIKNYYENPNDWSVYKCLVCGNWHIGHSKKITLEEKLKESQENIKFLKELIEKRDIEIYKLKDQLCYYLNLQKNSKEDLVKNQ